MDKRIGIQLYTLRDYCQTLEDFDKTCEAVSKMGYKIVQLSGIGNFAAKDIKEILDQYSLEVACTHRPPVNYLEQLDDEIEFHKTLGCNICGIGRFPDKEISLENIESFVENFRPVAQKLKEHGLVLAYHNHAFEFEKFNGKYGFEILKEKMASDNFKLILDVYWLSIAGINPVKFIQDHGDDVVCIHLKDLKVKGGNKPSYAPLGVGNLDWDEILPACEASKAQFALVEQDTCEGDPFDCVKISYDYISQKGYE